MRLFAKIKDRLYSYFVNKMIKNRYHNWRNSKLSRLKEIEDFMASDRDRAISNIVVLMNSALLNILGDYDEEAFYHCIEELDSWVTLVNKKDAAERTKECLEPEECMHILLELSDIAKSVFSWNLSEMGYKTYLCRCDSQREIENCLHCCFALADQFLLQTKTRDAIEILQIALYESKSVGYKLGEVISILRLLALRNVARISDPFINVDYSSEMLYEELNRVCGCDTEKLIHLLDLEYASIYSSFGVDHPLLLHAIQAKQELMQSNGNCTELGEENDDEANMIDVIRKISECIGRLSEEEVLVLSAQDITNEVLLRNLLAQYIMVMPEFDKDGSHELVSEILKNLSREMEELAGCCHSPFIKVLPHYIEAMFHLMIRNDINQYEDEYEAAMSIIDHSHRLADVHGFQSYFNSVVLQLITFMENRKDRALEIIEGHIDVVAKQDSASCSWYIDLLNAKLDCLNPLSKEWTNTACDIIREARLDILGRFHYLSNNQRSQLLSVWQKKTRNIVNCTSESINIETYNLLSLEKGILMTTSRELKKILQRDDRYVYLIDLVKELERYERNLKLNPSHRNRIEDEKIRMKSLELNAELFKLNHLGLSGILDFGFEQILGVLDDNEVVIDFYNNEIEDDDRQYFAYVIARNRSIQRVDICRESDLLRFANAYPGEPWRLYDNSEISRELCSLLWADLPINKNMTVFFSPTGSLLKVAVENLVVDETGKMLSECFANLVRISHPRYIKSMKEEPTISFDNTKKAIFGNMNYGGKMDEDSSLLGYAFNAEGQIEDGMLIPWGNLSRNDECDNISHMFRIQPKTTKEEFLALNNSDVDILHIMTHGFFFGLKTVRRLPKFYNAVDEMDTSGIVFEGANHAWMSKDDNWDGILRSSEIAHLNMSSIKLAVLSVCDSANGVIDRDGLVGLQRALKQAGVNTIIHSLWNVDVETSQLFTFMFYRNLMKGMNKREAFRLTVDVIKRESGMTRAFSDSYYYARYIMID